MLFDDDRNCGDRISLTDDGARRGEDGIIGTIGAMVVLPHFAERFGGMIVHMTVGNSTSDLGLQRSALTAA